MMIESLRLKKRREELFQTLKDLPEGTIGFQKNGKGTKWVIYNESPGYVYLAKKKKDLAQKLAFKKHITNQIDNIENQIQLIEEFLLKYSETPSSYAEFSAEDPKIQELIAPYFKNALDEYSRWHYTNYNKNGSIIFLVGLTMPHYRFSMPSASLDMNPRQCFRGFTPTAMNSRTACFLHRRVHAS